jgi:hypothetical protein
LSQCLGESRRWFGEDTGNMPLRARVREEVTRLSAQQVVAGSVERFVNPVAEELGPEVANAPFAE